MKHRKLVPASVIGLFSLSAVALAALPDFADVDADGDGMISSQEAADAGFSIAGADTDGDGQLSREEYDAASKS